MKIGVQLPEVEWEVPFPELIEMARVAERVGFDSVWCGDHLIYDLAVGGARAVGSLDQPCCHCSGDDHDRTRPAGRLDELPRTGDARQASRNS